LKLSKYATGIKTFRTDLAALLVPVVQKIFFTQIIPQ